MEIESKENPEELNRKQQLIKLFKNSTKNQESKNERKLIDTIKILLHDNNTGSDNKSI